MKKIFFIFILFVYCLMIISSNVVIADDVDTEYYSFSNNYLETSSDVFPNINSRAYIVYDRNTHSILVGKNENMKRKMASTTNVMTS